MDDFSDAPTLESAMKELPSELEQLRAKKERLTRELASLKRTTHLARDISPVIYPALWLCALLGGLRLVARAGGKID